MTCNKDGTVMEKAGYALTRDGAQYLTTWMCPKCFSRQATRSRNERYIPYVMEREKIQEEEMKRKKFLEGRYVIKPGV